MVESRRGRMRVVEVLRSVEETLFGSSEFLGGRE